MSSASEQIVGLYERHAHFWDTVRDGAPALEKPWLDRFCALLPPGAAILDIGCGSGQPIARDLIARGFEVSGVDASPAMISLCRGRFPRQTWRLGDMRTLALGERFAGLIAWDSFFHLTHADQRGMFPIFRRHAAPGAALLFTAGPSHSEAIGTMQGEPLYHASLSEPEYRALLSLNGFGIVERILKDPECGGHSVLPGASPRRRQRLLMDRATANLPSRDFGATAAFYGALGFTVRFKDEGWMILSRGPLELEFYPREHDPWTNWSSACFRVRDLDGLFIAFREAGIASAARDLPRLTAPDEQDGLRMFALVDPDGNLIRCIECR